MTFRLFPINFSDDSPGHRGLGELSDQELIAQYQKTEDTALVWALMKRFEVHIAAFGSRHLFAGREDIRDFTNDLFLKLCDDLKRVEVSNFRSWFYVYMKNMHFDYLRRQKVRRSYLKKAAKEELHFPEQALIQGIDNKLLHQALDALSEKEALCIKLVYLEAKSYREIMTETGWTFNQIRGLRERATKKLKTMISDEFDLP